MVSLISVHKLSYANINALLYRDVSISLNNNEKISFIGSNGAGKSTFLNLLNKNLEPNSGIVTHNKNMILYTLEQSFRKDLLEKNILDAVVDILPEDEREYSLWEAELALEEVGFKEEHLNFLCSELSGGWQMRILFARAVLLKPNVLFLDEPTNNLDLPSLLWLERFLKNWKGSFVVISHDETFLNNVSNCTWIVSSGNIFKYGFNCSKSIIEHSKHEEDLQKKHSDEGREIKRLENSAKRLAMWGKNYDNENFARKAKSMFKNIDKLKQKQVQTLDNYPWSLVFSGEQLKADRLLYCEKKDIYTIDNSKELFSIGSFIVKSKDKIALLGSNGCGKSTFLNLLHNLYCKNEVKNIKIHPNVRLAYYDQMTSGLNDELNLIDAVVKYCEALGTAVSYENTKMALIGVGFDYNKLNDKVISLSGGERSRAMLTGISLINSHILIMDEPTNHIDIQGKEDLAEQLKNYNGALIVVSHDRKFIEATCNRYITIHNKEMIEHNSAQYAYEEIFHIRGI